MADKPTMLGQAERDTNGPVSLKDRFERFMSSADFAENIDALTVNGNIPGRRKADYLALRRSVIIEQKSIDRDVDAKVSAFLGELIRQHGPLAAGDVTLAGIIDAVAKLPPPNLFKRRLRAILTQRIDDYLAEADKQTRDTRLTFSIPTALGVVVILNEHAQLIEPDYFVDKAWDMLRKEASPGQLRYPENQIALLISEAHRIPMADGTEMIPIETIFSEAGLANPAAVSFAEQLRLRWAEFNQAGALEWIGLIRQVTAREPSTRFKAI
jgi:hypothetical protein